MKKASGFEIRLFLNKECEKNSYSGIGPFIHIQAYTSRESKCFQAQKGVSVYEKSFLYFHAAGYAGSGTAAGDGAGQCQ